CCALIVSSAPSSAAFAVLQRRTLLAATLLRLARRAVGRRGGHRRRRDAIILHRHPHDRRRHAVHGDESPGAVVLRSYEPVALVEGVVAAAVDEEVHVALGAGIDRR